MWMFGSRTTVKKVHNLLTWFSQGEGSLFLGRLDQGLVGNAESTHVNRPKGKAPFVP